ncbi:MAG: methyltransferase family protein [Candidatus Methanofastidiosia archaeon]
MSHEKNIVHIAGHIAYIVLYGLLILFSILFYNSANLVALLYIGWITLAFGIIILSWSSQSRKKGHISEEKGISKETLVESGMYAFVRHPEFLNHILIILALILIPQHLVSLVISATLIVLLCLAMIEEEKRNIEKFGDEYKDYMQRVPRINLLAGIIRHTYRKS